VLSLWERQLAHDDGDVAPELEGAERADVCIVGGGYLGLWTAIALKDLSPGADVVLVEARTCGSGASGRNGGFALSLWSKFPTLERACGADEALRLSRMSADAVSELGSFCAANSIECDYRQNGWIWAATGRAQIGSWNATVERVRRLGAEPFVELSPSEVAAQTGSATHLAGVFEPVAATVQPAALASGLRRAAVGRGVRIFERSPMRRLERDTPAAVVTDRGRVTASHVVLALNAWAGCIRELRRHLVVVASDVIATQPAPERLRDIGWADGACISDSRQLVQYYRTTGDGRIVFGKGGGALAFRNRIGASFFSSPRRASTVERHFRDAYPALEDVAVTENWAGAVDRTQDGLPYFSRLPGQREIVYGVGFSGNGVAPSLFGGRILASLLLGKDDEWSRAGLVRDPSNPFPPEPIRYLGGNLVRRAVVRTERLEDAGRRPGSATRALSALAPTNRGSPPPSRANSRSR
jgi:putative aminophosphonate oxidoreductase